VPVTRIVPFEAEHVPEAAKLLAERHAVHRFAEPLLPAIEDFEPYVAAELEGGGSGAVALRGDEVVGYLVGKREESPVGPALRSGHAGHAATEPEITRDLYAVAAGRWVNEGLVRHNVFVPQLDDLIEPWFRLSFGGSAIQALLAVPERATCDQAAGIRPSTPADLVDAARLQAVQEEHLTSSPSFNGFRRSSQFELEDEWGDTWTNECFDHFVAERGGRIVGHALLYRRPPDMRVPQGSIDLAGCATDLEVRGTGLGIALTNYVIAWAAENGFKTMSTDWRLTNLVASRFWPARGFRAAFIRVYRSIP
jgi:GNAT superfamily N-acetyltransferase